MSRPYSTRKRLETYIVSTHLVFILDPLFLSTLACTFSWHYPQKIKLIFFFFLMFSVDFYAKMFQVTVRDTLN